MPRSKIAAFLPQLVQQIHGVAALRLTKLFLERLDIGDSLAALDLRPVCGDGLGGQPVQGDAVPESRRDLRVPFA